MDQQFRISVKRQGSVSSHLHDRLAVGDVIEALGPRGSFTLPPGLSAVLLLSAGIGITPMLSMVREAVAQGIRTGQLRPITFVHVARTANDRPFAAELSRIATASAGRVRMRLFETRTGMPREGRGLFSLQNLEDWLSGGVTDAYLCGPGSFVQDAYEGLRGHGLDETRIHAESFGPSRLQRAPASATSRTHPSARAEVVFARSGISLPWHAGSGTLLEVAEAAGLSPETGCRAGICGACSTRVLEGRVSYRELPAFPHEPEMALLCCASPHAAESVPTRLVLDL
jgi:hypothetical protein